MMRISRKVASDVDEGVLLRKRKGKLAFMKRKRRLTIMLLMELHQKSWAFSIGKVDRASSLKSAASSMSNIYLFLIFWSVMAWMCKQYLYSQRPFNRTHSYTSSLSSPSSHLLIDWLLYLSFADGNAAKVKAERLPGSQRSTGTFLWLGKREAGPLSDKDLCRVFVLPNWPKCTPTFRLHAYYHM